MDITVPVYFNTDKRAISASATAGAKASATLLDTSPTTWAANTAEFTHRGTATAGTIVIFPTSPPRAAPHSAHTWKSAAGIR